MLVALCRIANRISVTRITPCRNRAQAADGYGMVWEELMANRGRWLGSGLPRCPYPILVIYRTRWATKGLP